MKLFVFIKLIFSGAGANHKLYKLILIFSPMVLEALIHPKRAEKTYGLMLIYGFFFATIAIILSLLIFQEEASMVSVFLTVMMCIPLMYSTMKLEEKEDLRFSDERVILRHHWKALRFLIFMFFGFIIAYSLWFVILPESMADSLFSTQLATIGAINSHVSGNTFFSDVFSRIFLNNFKVLLFCFFFSFFFGAGAIFILTWNASVIGAAMGTFVRDKLHIFGSPLLAYPFSLFRYMTHGVFEVLAYFVGGLAGGIISVAIINEHFKGEYTKRILKDSFQLMLLALIMLVIAGLVEVYITPLLF